MRVVVCIPIYDDWESAQLLLPQLDEVARSCHHAFDVLFVDDGSSELPPARLAKPPSALQRVSVLRLRRNLGHQRAIAVGLTHLHVSGTHDAVVVMDGDGEDRPGDVPRLLDACESGGGTRVVFAQRKKRVATLGFRLGYACFKALHFVLVGRGIEVGNFSVVPRSALSRLVCVTELWNHYAAAVYRARLPTALVPTTRAERLAGRSKMNLPALVAHGMSAISVYSDIVGARVLQWAGLAMVAMAAAILAVVAVKFGTDLAIPGWATNAAGMLGIAMMNLTVISILMALFTLRSRTEYSFIPLRDYGHFVLDELTLHECT